MDLDLEISSNEGNSSEPLFNSIMNAINSMKEATADKIYQRIQKEEGAQHYSKPQVDRALASALRYGIFELHNNRYKVRDDIVDDEDTIYSQAHIKRERTPYRLDNNRGDFINPEKDRHTFRKLYVNENNVQSIGVRKRKNLVEIKHQKGKAFRARATTPPSNNKSKKLHRKQQVPVPANTKSEKAGKARPIISNDKETVKKISQRAIRRMTLKDAKKIKRVSNESDRANARVANKEKPANYIKEQTKEPFSSREKPNVPNKGNGRRSTRHVRDRVRDVEDVESVCDEEKDVVENDEDAEDDEEIESDGVEDDEEDDSAEEEDEEEEDNDDDYDDKCQCADDDVDAINDTSASELYQNKDSHMQSSYFDYMKEPYMAKFGSGSKGQPSKCGKWRQSNQQMDDTAILEHHIPMQNQHEKNTGHLNADLPLKTENITPDWNLNYKSTECSPINELYGKTDWLGNRSHDIQCGTVKQFDNSLKIEPIDSLPFKNIEETSYIS